MGSDDSGDEDDAAGIQAQVAQMLGPLQTKLKKAQKKIDKLEATVEELKKVGEESLPKVRQEMTSASSDASARLERIQAEVATLATKTSLEIVREETGASESRMKKQLDEQRSKTAAQELLIQSLTSRIDAMERAERERELKMSNELSAALAQLSQLNAALERHKGETEARLSEASARSSTQHDALLARIGQAEENGQRITATLASKSELSELQSTVHRRHEESEGALQDVRAKYREALDGIEALRANLVSGYATSTSLEALNAKTEDIGGEVKRMLERIGAQADNERKAWEDKLLQRQHGLEAQSQEARRDWHRLSAQVDTLSTYVSERTLRTEHEELAASVAALREEAASKEELGAVESVAKAAAGGVAFAVLEAEVKSLTSNTKAEAANSEERFARTADASAFSALEERVASLAVTLESKMSLDEGHAAINSKLEKALGEQTAAEVEGLQQRVGQLHERTNEAELLVSKSGNVADSASRHVDEVRTSLEELRQQQELYVGELQRKGSEVQDLIKAVRALTADAEMRAALDEREIEFLWAAPGQIYGQHGWRPNNGSKSERTPYPVGNFKMAVRHGTEGNARDVLARRKKWLNSITVGQREADALENDAANAGGPADKAAVPVRLPDIEEYRKARGSRPDSPLNGVLGPAHQLLNDHATNMGGGVGLPGGRGGGRGRATRVADVSAGETLEPWKAPQTY